MNILVELKLMTEMAEMKKFKSSLYVLVGLWDNPAQLQPSNHEYR